MTRTAFKQQFSVVRYFTMGFSAPYIIRWVVFEAAVCTDGWGGRRRRPTPILRMPAVFQFRILPYEIRIGQSRKVLLNFAR